MANEFKITDIVDPKAPQQLRDLNKDFETTGNKYAELANIIAGGIKFNPSDLESMDKKQKDYISTLKDLIATQNKLSSIQERQNKLIEDYGNKISKLLTLNTLPRQFDDLTKSINKVSNSLDDLSSKFEKSSTSQNSASQSNQQYTQSVQQTAQAISLTTKQYAEIINNVMAYDESAGRLNRNLAENKIQLSGIRKELAILSKEYQRGAISRDVYISKTEELTRKEQELSAQNKQYSALLRNHASVVVSTAGSYNEMSSAVLQLEKRFKDLAPALRNGDMGKGLLTQISTLKNELKSIDSRMGNYQRNVGNYSSHWNGLGMSVQQVARELPSLAMGWNTFFLAISNNLPILSDELKKANAEFKATQASGQKATPVWRQLTKSIFNWQTALVVGITLLSVYGKDIINWTKNIFKAKEAINDIISAERMFVVAKKEGINSSIKERTELKSLYGASQDVSRTITERRIAIEELQKKYPDYFGNLSDEEILAGKAAKSYEKLTTQILRSAQARAIQDKLTDRAKEQLELEDKLNNLYYERSILNDKNKENHNKLSKGAASATNAAKDIYKTSQQIVEVDEKILEIQSKLRENERQNIKLQSKLNVEDLLHSSDDATDEEEKRRKEAEKANKERLRIQQEYQQSEFDLMDEGLDKELAKIALNYNKRIAAVKGNSEDEINTRKNIAEEMKRAIEDKTISYNMSREKTDISNKLEVVKKGSEEELRLKIKQLNLMRETEIDESEKTGQDVFAIDEKYNAKRLELIEKFANDKNKKVQESYAMQSVFMNQSMQNELRIEADAYTSGEISKEEYEKRKLKIQQDYAIKSAQLAIDSIKTQLDTKDLSPEDKMALENKLAEAEIALSNLVTDTKVANAEKEADARKKNFKDWEDGLAMVGDALNAFADLGSAIYERKIEEVEGEQEKNQEAGEAEQERIDRLAESGAISTEEAEARKRGAAAQTAEKDKELAKKKADLQTKQAKMDKANAIVQSIINTAIAVMKVWGQTGIGGFALAPVVAALGAIQLATIIAQPIPKYAKGTDNHPGGLAVVGDGGKQEMIVSNGKSWITPSVPTLVDIPKGAAVLPDVMNMESIRGMKSDVMLLLNEAARKGDPVTVNVNSDFRKLEGEMKNMNSSFNAMAKYQRKAAVQADLRNIASRL